MPNHVYFVGNVTGPEDVIAEFYNSHIVDNRFEFDTLIPMPIRLRNTTSPSYYRDDPALSDRENATAKIDHDITNDLLRNRYGADNWYDWANKNWNTKWGAYDCEFEYNDTNWIQMRFQTAWSMPTPIFEEIAELYPELTFAFEVCEEGGYFAGKVIIDGGEVIEELTNDGDVWQEYAKEVMGWDIDDEE